MAQASSLPNISAAIADQRGLVTQAWRDFFLRLSTASDAASVADAIAELGSRVDALEAAGERPELTGAGSVTVAASQVKLRGDNTSPGALAYYGTDADEAKGFHSLETELADYTDDRADARIAAYTATLASLPNALDDAAAATSGVPVGGQYRNGSVLMIRIA